MEIKASLAWEGERSTYSEAWDLAEIYLSSSSVIHGVNKKLDNRSWVVDHGSSKTRIAARQRVRSKKRIQTKRPLESSKM